MLLEHKSKGTIHSLIMIPRMPTFAVSGALLELAGTLNSGASFYGTEHLGILQAIPPLDAGMLVKSSAGFSQQYVCLYVANIYL